MIKRLSQIQKEQGLSKNMLLTIAHSEDSPATKITGGKRSWWYFDEAELAKWLKRHSGVAVIVLFLMLTGFTAKAEAAVITGDEPVGGVSYYLDKYIKAGGDPRDLIAAYDISADDKEVLCRIVEAEVTGTGDESYYRAKANVASCVLTRLDKGWGKTVREIVFEPKQFSPVGDGRYYTVEITQQTRDAVQEVIWYGPKHECEYFCTRTCASYKNGYHSKLTEVFHDCVHAYFKEEK